MSLIRILEGGEWEEIEGMYVYPTHDGHLHGTNLDVAHFIELAMRALDQSGELDPDELERAHAALRARFNLDGGAGE